jgi:hypothetical protein
LKEKKMADKDQVRKDKENVKNTPQEAEVTELDDQSLDEASGGLDSTQRMTDTNYNCVC